MAINKELAEALDKLRAIKGEDFMAVASWMRQEGRAALRERGASDDNIGPCRLDIDKFGDAPWVKAPKEEIMAKEPANHNQSWSNQDVRKLSGLADGNTPTRLIAWKLKRTESSVRSKAADVGISLKPVNQSPYNRRTK
jgi:hypothetical protein